MCNMQYFHMYFYVHINDHMQFFWGGLPGRLLRVTGFPICGAKGGWQWGRKGEGTLGPA